MKAEFVSSTAMAGSLLDPDGAAWAQAHPRTVRLVGTPAGMQPTEAIRNAWLERPIGAVSEVVVSALHEGEHLYFRLEWPDATANRDHGDNRVFPDGAALAFPVHPDAPLLTMGAPGYPINAWFWRAEEPERGRHVFAEGFGTSKTLDRKQVRCRGAWRDGHWRVVIARALRLQSTQPVVQFEAGARCRFGIAVWEGSRQERAGLKAFNGDWFELDLAPARS